MKPKIEYIIIFAIIAGLVTLSVAHTYESPNSEIFSLFKNLSNGSSSSPPPSHVDKGISPAYNTPEGKAVFIARLQEGVVQAITVRKVELVNVDDKRLWKVEVTRGSEKYHDYDQWYVYVDPNGWVSKKSKFYLVGMLVRLRGGHLTI